MSLVLLVAFLHLAIANPSWGSAVETSKMRNYRMQTPRPCFRVFLGYERSCLQTSVTWSGHIWLSRESLAPRDTGVLTFHVLHSSCGWVLASGLRQRADLQALLGENTVKHHLLHCLILSNAPLSEILLQHGRESAAHCLKSRDRVPCCKPCIRGWHCQHIRAVGLPKCGRSLTRWQKGEG